MRGLSKVYPRVCGVDEADGGVRFSGAVYPRVCGVDAISRYALRPRKGLSPRVRGR